MRQAKVRYNLSKKTSGIVMTLAVCLLAASVNAQQRDPRIGEWREDRTANSVGLYNVFEDLGNGMIRVRIAHNLSPQNRLYLDHRCDGNFYPIRNYQGVATDFSESCTIVDANTVTIKGVRNKDKGFTGPKLDQYWFDGEGTGTVSSDGNHYRTVMQQKDGDGKVIRTSERTYTRNAERCFSSDEQKFRECQQRTSPPRN
jgi:hypothetical protein